MLIIFRIKGPNLAHRYVIIFSLLVPIQKGGETNMQVKTRSYWEFLADLHSEGGTGENQRIDPHLNFGIFHRKQ